jgi:hypothetical protein
LPPHIGRNEGSLSAGVLKFSLQSLAFGLSPRGHGQPCAILGERQGGEPSDACEGSYDQNNWLAHIRTLDSLQSNKTAYLQEFRKNFACFTGGQCRSVLQV